MLDVASQTLFTDSESDVRHCEGIRGGPLQGDFWSRIRLWKAVAKQITGSRCQPAGGPVLIVYQPEDPWEVRERLLRGFRGVSVTAGGLKRC